jgi:predicted MFS family arabinose efflux permease
MASANLINYMDRMALPVLMPAIKAELRLTDTQLGLLTGYAFALFYAAFGVPIARWADCGIRRNIIALALITWSVMTALSGVAQNFWQLFFARVGVGAGEAGCIPHAHSLISDYVPAVRRPGAIAVHTAGATIGIILGMALAGWLGARIGWRLSFLVLGLPGVLLAIIVRVTLREPPRGYADGMTGPAIKNPPLKVAFQYLWRCRSYVQLVTIMSLAVFVNFALNQWLPSFYMRAFGMKMAAVGLYLGLAQGLGATVGTLGGGFLANSMSKRDARYPLMLAAACFAAAFPLALAIFLAPTSTWALGANFLFAVVSNMPNGTLFALIQNVVHPNSRALASALNMLSASVVGIGGGPFFVGVVSDALAPVFDGQSLRYALMLATVILIWPAIHCLLAMTHLKADLNAACRARSDNEAPFPQYQ